MRSRRGRGKLSRATLSVLFRYAYLHGFASSASSYKGTALRERLGPRYALALPDLNRPSFGRLSHRAMLDHLDALDEGGPPWRLIGSSLGGWLAARWAMLRPDRVDRLVLLCPGFELASRWPVIVGREAMKRWEERGALPMKDAAGQFVDIGYGFFEEARSEIGTPEVECPTCIVHGVRDAVVPVDGSRRYAASRPHVELIEVDDEHGLAGSLDRIEAVVRAHFDG